MIRITNTKEKD